MKKRNIALFSAAFLCLMSCSNEEIIDDEMSTGEIPEGAVAVSQEDFVGATDKPCGGSVMTLPQKLVAKRYIVVK